MTEIAYKTAFNFAGEGKFSGGAAAAYETPSDMGARLGPLVMVSYIRATFAVQLKDSDGTGTGSAVVALKNGATVLAETTLAPDATARIEVDVSNVQGSAPLTVAVDSTGYTGSGTVYGALEVELPIIIGSC